MDYSGCSLSTLMRLFLQCTAKRLELMCDTDPDKIRKIAILNTEINALAVVVREKEEAVSKGKASEAPYVAIGSQITRKFIICG